MSDTPPTANLDIHAKAGPAQQFKLGDFIDFEAWQYKVIGYDPQPDGTVKVMLEPTGRKANHVAPTTPMQ